MMKDIDIDILALSIRSAVERECQGFTVGYKESMVIAARILSGQQGGAVPAIPDRASSEADLKTTPQACSQRDLDRAIACVERMMAAFGRLAKQPAVPAGDLVDDLGCAHFAVAEAVFKSRGRSADEVVGIRIGHLRALDQVRARLAEQPAPAGTGDADRVEGLQPGIEKALEIVEAERETVSISSSAYQRLSSVHRALRAALDGASGQGEAQS